MDSNQQPLSSETNTQHYQKHVNTDTKSDSKQYHQKLKHDCNKNEAKGLTLFLSKAIAKLALN